MGRLRVLSGKQVCDLLRSHGFHEVRQRGSHIVMQRSLEEGGTITVPVPLHRQIRRGTLLSIMRQSGLPRTLFEAEG